MSGPCYKSLFGCLFVPIASQSAMMDEKLLKTPPQFHLVTRLLAWISACAPMNLRKTNAGVWGKSNFILKARWSLVNSILHIERQTFRSSYHAFCVISHPQGLPWHFETFFAGMKINSDLAEPTTRESKFLYSEADKWEKLRAWHDLVGLRNHSSTSGRMDNPFWQRPNYDL